MNSPVAEAGSTTVFCSMNCSRPPIYRATIVSRRGKSRDGKGNGKAIGMVDARSGTRGDCWNESAMVVLLL
jgi:hypothetical protein